MLWILIRKLAVSFGFFRILVTESDVVVFFAFFYCFMVVISIRFVCKFRLIFVVLVL